MKTKPATASEPRRILVPVDISNASRQAPSATVALVRRFNSRRAVAHVTRHNRRDGHPGAEPLARYGRAGLGRALIGSGAGRRVQPAWCPVLIVR